MCFMKPIYDELLKTKDLSIIEKYRKRINSFVMIALKKDYHINEDDMENIKIILTISNILYNNTDSNLLILDDGVYDILLEKFKSINPLFEVGAIPISFAPSDIKERPDLKTVIKKLDRDKTKDFIFLDDLMKASKPNLEADLVVPIKRLQSKSLSKRNINVKHNYPKLVGSLDKCKFVANYQAEEKGVINDSNVKIFERDFIGKHITSGIINPSQELYVELSLKYDGVSVEGDVTNMIVGARSRGDAVQDIGADLTPIFYGYSFPNAPKTFWNKEPFGMKFEAIMTDQNIAKFNQLTGNTYKNGRTAIIGLLGRGDALEYRDLITLVPLETSLDIDRDTEIELMNKYYTSGVQFLYSSIRGDYKTIIFSVKKFVEEAEYMRSFLPFMYDGVVVTYKDEALRKTLGRTNAINKYSIAIKFTPLKALSVFRGYKYTIGEYGTITPMIYYDPVEFYGAIHDHSSGHSYERFKNLALRTKDIIEVEYTNDVMPYVTKPDNSFNELNSNPIVKFIDKCPSCGTPLVETESGKNIYCPNIACPARNTKRMVNMIKKLNMKDFGDARIESIKAKSLSELFALKYTDVEFLGNIMANKLLERINSLRTTPIEDYKIVGSLGFEGIGRKKWRLILNKFTLLEVMTMDERTLRNSIINIKGLGPSSVDIIISQMEFFRKDISIILSMKNIISTKGVKSGKKIRFTGFRDHELTEMLQKKGIDADDSSGVTKDTDILLVPEAGHTSSKTKKAIKYNESGSNIQIVPVNDFMDDYDKYLK